MPDPPVRVFLAVGSNIEPTRNVFLALDRLGPEVVPDGVGPCFWSAPLGRPEQPRYLNTVLSGHTRLSPRDLRTTLRRVEAALGRRRTADRYASRPIDLDILLYGNQVIREEGLRIPDPDIRTRAFVARPLLWLAPELHLPDSGQRLADVVAHLEADDLELDAELTARLRARIP